MWLWRLGRRKRHDEHAEAKAHLADLQAQAPEVDRLAEQLQEMRLRNHFSELVDQAIRQARSVP